MTTVNDTRGKASARNAFEPVLTGTDAYDTHVLIKSDGTENLSPRAGQPYDAIGWEAIVAMAEDPPRVDKDHAPWIIPSSYCGPDGRGHAAQREHGRFWIMPLDVDEAGRSLEDVEAALTSALGGLHEALIYSTRSSTEAVPKWRALVPLAGPVEGRVWSAYMRVFCDRVEAAGVKLDRVLCRTGQVAYLPNEGAHYDGMILEGPRFEPAAWVAVAEAAVAEEEARLEAARAAALAAPPRDGGVISQWCALHPLEGVLQECGYAFEGGRSPNWRSPLQQSASYATRVFYEPGRAYWISLSQTDFEAGVGQPTKDDHCFGDAFDIWVHFAHGGDFDEAMRAASVEVSARRVERLAERVARLPAGPEMIADAEARGEQVREDVEAREEAREEQDELEDVLRRVLVAYVPSITAQTARWFDLTQPATLKGTVAEMWSNAGVNNVYGVPGLAQRLLPEAQRTTKMPVIDPRLPYGFTEGEDGLGVINKCSLRAPEGEGAADDPAVVRFTLVLAQVVPDWDERLWFLDWLATKVQRPWERMVGVVNVARTHGTGRGGLFYILRQLFGGSPNAANVSMDNISGGTSQWSQWLEALLVTVEEADPEEERGVSRRSTSSRKAYAVLKDLVDPGVKHVRMNVKGGPTYDTQSFTSFLIATNSEDALPIAESDRRFAVLQGNDERAPESFYGLCKSLAEDEAALDAVWLWLKARDVSAFRCDVALKTSARALMIEAGKTDLDVDIESLLGACCRPCVVTSKLVMDLVAHHSETGKQMQREGYLKSAIDRWMRDNTSALLGEDEDGKKGAIRMSVGGFGQMRVRVPNYANLKAVGRLMLVEVQSVLDALAKDARAVTVDAMGAVRATKVRGV